MALTMFSSTVLADVSAWVNMDTSDGLVRIKTEVLGKPGDSIIHTGLSRNRINEVFLDTHELSPRKIGGRGATRGTVDMRVHVVDEKAAPRYAPLSVGIFNTQMDFRGLRGQRRNDPSIQLVIGSDFLRRVIVQFDYPRQKIRLLSQDSIDLKKSKNVLSKKGYRNGPTLVKLRFNDEIDAWVVLDTGNPGGLLLDEQFVAHRGWQKDPTVQSDGDASSIILPVVRIGPFEVGNVHVETFDTEEGLEPFREGTLTGTHVPRGNVKAVGTIGNEVLKHFVVTLDHKRGHVHVATKASN